MEGELLDIERGTQMFVTVRPRLANYVVASIPALGTGVVAIARWDGTSISPSIVGPIASLIAALLGLAAYFVRERVALEAGLVREELRRLLLL